jgi:hypothetical protein
VAFLVARSVFSGEKFFRKLCAGTRKAYNFKKEKIAAFHLQPGRPRQRPQGHWLKLKGDFEFLLNSMKILRKKGGESV